MERQGFQELRSSCTRKRDPPFSGRTFIPSVFALVRKFSPTILTRLPQVQSQEVPWPGLCFFAGWVVGFFGEKLDSRADEGPYFLLGVAAGLSFVGALLRGFYEVGLKGDWSSLIATFFGVVLGLLMRFSKGKE